MKYLLMLLSLFVFSCGGDTDKKPTPPPVQVIEDSNHRQDIPNPQFADKDFRSDVDALGTTPTKGYPSYGDVLMSQKKLWEPEQWDPNGEYDQNAHYYNLFTYINHVDSLPHLKFNLKLWDAFTPNQYLLDKIDFYVETLPGEESGLAWYIKYQEPEQPAYFYFVPPVYQPLFQRANDGELENMNTAILLPKVNLIMSQNEIIRIEKDDYMDYIYPKRE